jgi:hypothetical protein
MSQKTFFFVYVGIGFFGNNMGNLFSGVALPANEVISNLASLNSATKSANGFKLQHCVIDIGSSLDPLLPISHGPIISLKFLHALREDNIDPFLPAMIYVRDCMREIFALFLSDADQMEPYVSRTFLIGSPGVGKSVLFFLAALYRARDIVTIYYRRTESGEASSVFIMIPCNDKKVLVLFTKNLSNDAHLYKVDTLLRESLGIRREKYYVFVNGPRHDDASGTLYHQFDYLCTSGGHREFRSDEYQFNRRWILDGWTNEEAVHVLAIHGYGHKAARAYWLCGGNIREMIDSCEPRGFEATRENLDRAARLNPTLNEQLASYPFDRSTDNSDRVQTMFRIVNDQSMRAMNVIQCVDSEHVMNNLLGKVQPKVLFESYELSKMIRPKSAIPSLHFRYFIHSWFERNKPSPIADVYRPVP